MTIATIRGFLSGAVATGGTITLGYPSGQARGNFINGLSHRLVVNGRVFSCPEDITIAFNTASAVITYNGATTLPAGASFVAQFDDQGAVNPIVDAASGVSIFSPVSLGIINLGNPITASANAIYLSAALTAATLAAAVLTGALVAGGVAVMDARYGRNVVAAWTGTSILTVRGFDAFGRAMTESSGSGTTFTGVKAFARVTSIQVSADVTGLTVGSGVVLGLPTYLPNTAMVLRENLNGALATSGTLAAGLSILTKPTATNADIRGTYNPNSAPDGTRTFTLLVAIPDPNMLGATQFVA